jgi:hypothetical protein
MKKILIIHMVVVMAMPAMSQEKPYFKKGMRLYQQGKYGEAIEQPG